MTTYRTTADERAAYYDPAVNNYDLAKDPRCLWGWGDKCSCYFGHGCFRAFGHKGKCWDGVGESPADRLPCGTSQRPKDWDANGRAEANR